MRLGVYGEMVSTNEIIWCRRCYSAWLEPRRIRLSLPPKLRVDGFAQGVMACLYEDHCFSFVSKRVSREHARFVLGGRYPFRSPFYVLETQRAVTAASADPRPIQRRSFLIEYLILFLI